MKKGLNFSSMVNSKTEWMLYSAIGLYNEVIATTGKIHPRGGPITKFIWFYHSCKTYDSRQIIEILFHWNWNCIFSVVCPEESFCCLVAISILYLMSFRYARRWQDSITVDRLLKWHHFLTSFWNWNIQVSCEMRRRRNLVINNIFLNVSISGTDCPAQAIDISTMLNRIMRKCYSMM